jgi:putative transposase
VDNPRSAAGGLSVALMIDGVHFGEHTCVVALGIGIDGTRHPLAVEESSTENATLVTELITGLRERGLDVTRPIRAVLEGPRPSLGRSRMCSTSR